MSSQLLTPEEYVAMERVANHKSEYFAGEVFARAGAGERHVTIVSNLTYLFVSQFKGRPCKAYSSEMKVRVTAQKRAGEMCWKADPLDRSQSGSRQTSPINSCSGFRVDARPDI